jgi:hypothetical protein
VITKCIIPFVMHETESATANLITTGQAAAAFDPPCSTENVRRLVRVGRLHPAAIVGRGQMLFDRDAIRRIVEERRSLRAVR